MLSRQVYGIGKQFNFVTKPNLVVLAKWDNNTADIFSHHSPRNINAMPLIGPIERK